MEYRKSIETLPETDVLVCGGGPAGIMAALAAARCGASVTLLERQSFLGGMATAAMVAPVSEFMLRGEPVVGGLPREFIDRIAALGGGKLCAPKGHFVFHPEVYKLAAQRMLLEAGVQLHLEATIFDCAAQDGQIGPVLFCDRSGVHAISGRYVIDATGDGEISLRAGVPMQEDGPCQPATLCFLLGGVHTEQLRNYYPGLPQGTHGSTIAPVHDLLQTMRGIPPFGGPWCCAGVGAGTGIVNMTRCAVDMADARQATEATCRLREDVFTFVELLRENFAEFRDCYLLATGSVVGTRQTRHIRGVHVLRGEEYRHAVHFPDAIARCAHPIDIHSADGSEQRLEYLEEAAYLPYRSMIAAGFENLLVPSRCFSADAEAFAGARVQASVMGLGQAAGAAAAQCAAAKCSVHAADVPGLQAVLRQWGAYI